MAEPAVFYYPASKTGCFMASIHMYLLSLSTCTADRQLSSSGVLLFSSRFSLAIALQKLLCARQVVRDLKPTEKAPYPRAMAGFLFVVLLTPCGFLLSPQRLPPCQENPHVLQQKGLLPLPPGDHSHMGTGDASCSFAHTTATASPACEVGEGCVIYFFTWHLLAFLMINFLLFCLFFYCSFAKKGHVRNQVLLTLMPL